MNVCRRAYGDSVINRNIRRKFSPFRHFLNNICAGCKRQIIFYDDIKRQSNADTAFNAPCHVEGEGKSLFEIAHDVKSSRYRIQRFI